MEYLSDDKLLQLEVAREYGWTLDYIDTLPYATLQTILGLRIGENRAR